MSRILITGASKGLGRATAIELAGRGHEVIATARKVETLADLSVAQRLSLDVTDDASVQAALRDAGHVDVLINNAAEIVVAPVESVPFADVRNLYEINLFGTLRMIQAFLPQMRERRAGTIVNLSSVVARMAFPLTSIYSSTKWAIEGLSESLRLEVGHFGVHVVLVEPGQIGTGALDAPKSIFSANDPYLPLAESRPKSKREELTPPIEIARVVADAAEHPEQKFRWEAGADAIALLALRAKQDDATFEKTFRSALKLDW